MTTKEIAPSGGDFTSLSAWEASLSATPSSPQIANCHIFPGGLAEAGGVVFTGITTSSSNFIQIQAVGANQHTGVASTGFYVTSSGVGTIRSAIDYLYLVGLAVQETTHNAIVHNGGSNGIISRCLLTSASFGVLAGSSGALTITNTIIYNSSSDRTVDMRNFSSCIMQDCTVYSQSADFTLVAATETALTGVYAGGATNQSIFTGGGVTGSFNGSDDGSASAGSLTNGTTAATGSQQFVSVTSGSEDFHLKTGVGQKLIDAGTAIGGVTTDIIGTTRPQGVAEDIGAFEYIVVAPAAKGGTMAMMGVG